MYTVAGSTWVAQSASEYAKEALNAINSAIAPIVLTASITNVVWWCCLAIGVIRASYDITLAAAKNSLNVALCDDEQLLNLAPIAGVTPLPGSYATLQVQFTGDATGQTVLAGTHVKISNITAMFVTNVDLVVPASTAASVATTCDTIGAIVVTNGQVSGTVETLPHIASVTNTVSAISGAAPETMSAFRTRIITGKTIGNNLDGLTVALRSLSGIQYAAAYYNTSLTTPLTLPGSISLPARTLYMVVLGSSSEIADTYAARSMAPTYGSQSQTFTSKSGQAITVNYDLATTTPIYVQVFVNNSAYKETTYIAQIQAAVLTLAGQVSIGQTITQEMVSAVFANATYATINGVSVSLNGSSWGRTAVVAANAVGTFSSGNITVTTE